MADLYRIGFEENSVVAGVEFSNAISTPTISTTTVHGGTYALRISSLSSGTAKGFRNVVVASPVNGPLFVRAYINVATRPSAANRIIFLNDSDNQTTPMVWINLLSDGTLTLNDEDGAIGSASSALTLNTWYRIEFKIDRTGAAGSHIVEAMLAEGEGAASVFATSSTRDISAGVNVIGIGGNLASEAQTTGDWFFDDIAVNDSAAGGTQTTYPGAGKITHRRPSAPGDNAGWVLGTGTTFAELDEITPDDVTTYIAANTATGVDATDCSDFNIDDMPADMDSGATINVVMVGHRSTLSDATGADPAAVLRIKASAAGTVQESANLASNTTTWFSHNPNSPYIYKLKLYDLPGASTTAWTKTDLDAAQIGVRLSTTDTHLFQVSALWLLVDYTPSTGQNASLASTLGALTSSSAGTVDVTGALTLTLNAASSSSGGNVTIDALVSNTLAQLALSGTGDVTLTASLLVTLAALSLSGGAIVDVTGSLSSTLSNVTSSGSGNVDISVLLGATLGALQSTASGNVAVTGELLKTLGLLVSSANGDVTITGALVQTLGALLLNAEGTTGGEVLAQLGVTLGALTLSGGGNVTVDGIISQILSTLTSAGSATVDVGSAVSQTLGALTVLANGSVSVTGSLNQVLSALLLVSAGSLETLTDGFNAQGVFEADLRRTVEGQDETFTVTFRKGYKAKDETFESKRRLN